MGVSTQSTWGLSKKQFDKQLDSNVKSYRMKIFLFCLLVLFLAINVKAQNLLLQDDSFSVPQNLLLQDNSFSVPLPGFGDFIETPPFPSLSLVQCRTVRGRRCIFPFTYKGRRFHECTLYETTNGRPWCAYQVDIFGEALRGHYCDTSVCPAEEEACVTESGPGRGKQCKFPFTYQGRTYNSCARWTWKGRHYGKYWCSTRTDRFGNHVSGGRHFGFCGFCDQPGCRCGCTGGPTPSLAFTGPNSNRALGFLATTTNTVEAATNTIEIGEFTAPAPNSVK